MDFSALCGPYPLYRQGQEHQLAALGFALNVLVLWNTQYMDDAVNHLRASGREIND
jgi:TnpA family transposase